jgi:cysteinyl-tRNA synthetase
MLKNCSARVIKLYFFLHRYDVILNYDPETSLKESTQKDTRYKNFFSTLKAAIRDNKLSAPQKPTA